MELVRAEAGNEVLQGLGQRKARVPGLCLGWSGCGLPNTAVVSELASEDGARREKVGRAVPGEPSLLAVFGEVYLRQRTTRTSPEGGSGPSEMSSDGWDLGRSLGTFLSTSKFKGKGHQRGRSGGRRTAHWSPVVLLLPRQEEFHLERRKEQWAELAGASPWRGGGRTKPLVRADMSLPQMSAE